MPWGRGMDSFIDSALYAKELRRRAERALARGMPRELFNWEARGDDEAQHNADALERYEAEQKPKPRTTTPSTTKGRYAQGTLRGIEAVLSAAPEGERDDATNDAIWRLATLVNDGALTAADVRDSIIRSACANGLDKDRKNGGIAKIESNVERGLAKQIEVFDWDTVNWSVYDDEDDDVAPKTAGKKAKSESSDGTTEFGYIVTLVPASEIVSDIPDWVWEYDDLGRIQLGVLTLFAGRPGAGKSTAARWFAAQISKGALDGYWKDKPQKVAYIASEESLEQVVKPGLQLAGANMDNIVFPKVTFDGEAVALMSDRDEAELTKQLQAQHVTAIFVDPIMATIRRKVDIYRNNELREALNPWVRIAQRLKGTVVGVVHLTKGNSGDVVAAVNGSSAFGEVARCVFGFAKDPQNDGERVMSQVKNACGVEDLSLSYEISVQVFTADSGRKGLMPVFDVTGDSDTTVSEILSTVAGKLRPSTQAVVDFVKGRTETGAQAVVDAGLAKTLNTAQKMLRRLSDRGLIDNPTYGHYCPKLAGPTVFKPL
jgi:hypothetical protein